MTITLETVQTIAPDQASLVAAKKLLKPAKWTLKQKLTSDELIWGHCQGSGANPYYTVIDTKNHGYKCSCPSRKFPCKHVLALMWQYAEDTDSFMPAELPTWVGEWLVRRRNTGQPVKVDKAEDKAASKKSNKKSLASMLGDDESAPDSETAKKKQAAAAKRAAKLKAATDTTIANGLKEYEQWLADQMCSGLMSFLEEANSRCRNIRSRLVDAKATSLAARVDELPAKLMNLPKDMQLKVAVNELGKMAWLAKAWQINPDDPDTRRAIASAPSRDKLLEQPHHLRQDGVWEVIAEQIENRRDGLISHATWLYYLDKSDDTSQSQDSNKTTAPAIPFALLQDYYPVSAGRPSAGVSVGDVLSAEMIYYPSRYPLRAVIVRQQSLASITANPQSQIDLGHTQAAFYSAYQNALAQLPWLEYMPYRLPVGRIKQSQSNDKTPSTPRNNRQRAQQSAPLWWQANLPAAEQWQLPLRPHQHQSQHALSLMLASELSHSFVLWDGIYASLGSAVSPAWGQLTW